LPIGRESGFRDAPLGSAAHGKGTGQGALENRTDDRKKKDHRLLKQKASRRIHSQTKRNPTVTPKAANLLEQFRHETMTWLRSLDFYKQENSHLMNRLTEVVDGTTDRDFLAQAEHFQNQFIIKDEFMDILRHDINEQEKRLVEKQRRREESLDGDLESGQIGLRDQVAYLEKDFTELRNDFNRYLVVMH
jgi:hypothetical protein